MEKVIASYAQTPAMELGKINHKTPHYDDRDSHTKYHKILNVSEITKVVCANYIEA